MPEPKGARRLPPRRRLPCWNPRPGRPAGSNLLFLREEEIRQAQDLLFFAYRDFTNAADVILEEMGLGRAHHRALHFIGRNPGHHRVRPAGHPAHHQAEPRARAAALMEQGYVAQTPGRADRRQRLLTLTAAGQALERRLYERQRERLAAAYREAGAAAVDGFRSVMRGIMDDAARAHGSTARPGRPHATAHRNQADATRRSGSARNLAARRRPRQASRCRCIDVAGVARG